MKYSSLSTVQVCYFKTDHPVPVLSVLFWKKCRSILKYGFCKKSLRKMQLWIVEHFHLHKKIPVLMNHNIWFFFKCYDSLVQVPFCEDESVQLFKVAFFPKGLLSKSILYHLDSLNFQALYLLRLCPIFHQPSKKNTILSLEYIDQNKFELMIRKK